ncbi:MAG: hypothetical protein Q8Q26_14760 [Pseudorhodobacter sp.]|nr:hypothetical protein [Pseudorhodobacter sp.]
MGHSSSDLSDLLGPEEIEPIAAAIPAIMGEAELSSFLGLSSSRIRTLAADGVFVRSGRGRFDVAVSIRRYVARLQDGAARAGRPSEGGEDLKAEKLRLTAAQREAQELKNAVTRGDLVSAEDVKQGWASILTDVRAGVLAVPARLIELSPDQRSKLDLEIRLALERLSHG